MWCKKSAPIHTSPTPSLPTMVPSVASNVQIKKEAHAVEEESTSMEESMDQQLGSSGLTKPTNLEQLGVASTTSISPDTEDLKNQCEKCKKAFASLTLLRYHYCSHFRGILKKKFSNLFHENKCLECFKTFANPGRLLLHIGVQHDKINDILKSKGITELPPFSATAAALGAEEASGNGATAGIGDTKEQTETQEVATTSTPMRDVKNIQLIKSVTEMSATPTPQNTSTPAAYPKVLPNTSNVSLNETTSSNVSNVTSRSNTSIDKNDSTSECNYELECQVCDQKLKTISLLEQHCCRHFMKELQDQYSSLMDGLKCNVCYNSFKQKHSLLLHIGCKHGKINDILKQKNFAALPCPVTNTTSAAMQKQLIQIKKEKQDMKEETYNMRNEMMEEETTGSSSGLLNETPPAPEETTPAFSTTLDEILKKYRFPAGSSGST